MANVKQQAIKIILINYEYFLFVLFQFLFIINPCLNHLMVGQFAKSCIIAIHLFSTLVLPFCNQTASFTANLDCVFSYGYSDPNCTSFAFSSCAWSNGDQSGDRTSSSPNWSVCTGTCCNPSLTYSQSTKSISDCLAYIKAQDSSSLSLGLSITAAILCFVMIPITILFCRNQKYRQEVLRVCCCCCLKGRLTVAPSSIIESSNTIAMKNHEYDDSKIEYSETLSNRNWKRKDLKYSLLNEECCICLEPKSSLQLQCSHVYHRACIFASLERSAKCPICRTRQINNSKIYCEVCFEEYYMTTIKEHKRILKILPQICNNCAMMKQQYREFIPVEE